MSCIFCEIIAGRIPCSKIYEDEWVLAFEDIHPVADTHVLIVPKTHVSDVQALGEGDEGDLTTAIFKSIATIAKQLGVIDRGYHLLTNCGAGAGQTVMHLHFHLISGAGFTQPLGEIFEQAHLKTLDETSCG